MSPPSFVQTAPPVSVPTLAVVFGHAVIRNSSSVGTRPSARRQTRGHDCIDGAGRPAPAGPALPDAPTPATEQGDLAEFLEAAFAGGVDIVQIREKDMDPEAELEVLEMARAAAMLHQDIVCVNDSADARRRVPRRHAAPRPGRRSVRAGPRASCTAGRSSAARPTAPPRSTRALADEDVDYLSVGPVYATSTATRRTRRSGWIWCATRPRSPRCRTISVEAVVRHRRHRCWTPSTR